MQRANTIARTRTQRATESHLLVPQNNVKTLGTHALSCEYDAQQCRQKSQIITLKGRSDVSLGVKPFDFGADVDHDSRISDGMFFHCGYRTRCKNFDGTAALGEGLLSRGAQSRFIIIIIYHA